MKKLLTLLFLTCGLTTGLWASSIPGALSGRFTINASGEKVVFSQGNLQYVGTWQFAENQWDCFSTSQYNDHRDLFGWGTGDAPNKVSNNNGDYGTFTDWGTNAITNGGNTENSGWRTLTKDEWVYLFYSRKNAATLFGFGSVNSKNGLIILPDNWTTPEGASFTASTTLGLTNQGSYYHNGKEDNYTHNTYTAEQWAVMESAGAVFLPAAAYRHGVDSNINYTDLGGFYWSSTPSSTDKAYYLNFYYNDLDPQFNEMRYGGRPVRLVRSSLEKDGEGNYLLSSADDWKDFAAIVNNTNPAANAKMTADIDLGDDQTHIGDNNNLSYAYGGIFDGQGHTLNVNYYSTSSSTAVEGGYSIAPFRNIKGATIKNLTVTGNITGYRHCAGVVGYTVSPSTNLISNVTVSATINIVESYGGGFIGHCETSTTTIQDCLFNGTIKGKAGGSVVGVFFANSNGASMSLTNCLENGSYTNCSTFSPTSCPTGGTTAVTNCHYTVSGSYSGTHASATELADGTTAYKLQNNRADLVWGQRIGTDAKPVLTGDESYRVYRSKNGGYTNNPEDAYEGLQQDGEGYYLLGGLTDWQDFATLVETTPTANAKMTADINLGDDQTKIGSYATRYSGTFDGQGHTLTFNYNTSSMSIESGQSYLGAAPFRDIEGATIRNLRTAGSITADKIGASGLVGWAYGTNTIENCWSDVNLVSSNNVADTFTGFVAFMYGTSITITDCIFTGRIQSTSKQSHSGFIGYHYSGTSALTNCLVILDEGSDTNKYDSWNITFFTFDRFASSDQSAGTYTNCYYYRDFGVAQGTKATAAQLSDGTTAYKLQNNRGDMVWGQRIGTDAMPVLTNDENYRVYRSKTGGYTNNPEEAYEGIQQDGEGNYLLGCLSDWQDFAEIVNSGTNPAANAKMTADINLGDDQTMIGTGTQWSDYGETGILRFQGVFDGQGHTLTINYNATTESFTAPFRHIKKATIKNLRVAGTITTNHTIAAGIASSCAGNSDNSYIINCVSSVDIISNYVNSGHPIYDGARTAGIIGQIFHNAHINISDCIFNGSISGEKQQVLWGGMVGLPDGPVTITNSLQIGSFDCSDVVTGNEGSGTFSTIWNKNINITNSYYLNALGAVQGTQATSTQLADGTTTTALQAGRAEIVWVQDPGTNQPMLALFAGKYKVPTSGLGTFSAKAAFTLPDGLDAYYCKDYDTSEGTIGVVAINGVVPAETGVLLRGEPGETYTLTTSDETAATVTDNALVAVTEQTSIQQTEDISEVNYTNFGLSGGVFKKVNTNGGTVKANRAYLRIPTSALTPEASARGILLAWDGEPTGVGNLDADGNLNLNDNLNLNCYDLQGRRVVNPARGLYIVNGKKVVIK